MFPNKVNSNQAPGVLGDFASTNPFASILAGPGALIAPAGGLRVGNFAWVGPQGQVSQSYVAGYQIGFLGRNMQALIQRFLGEESLVVPEGFMVTLFNSGDFWAKFASGATVGNNVYADPNDGAPLAGATAPALGTVTGVAAYAGTITTVNASATITVVSSTQGPLSPGDTLTSTNVPVGSQVTGQLTGTPGGVGTYTISNAASAAGTATAATSVSNKMLVTAVASGALIQGDVLSGTNVVAGTAVLSQAAPFSGVATTAASTVLNVTFVTPGSDLLRVGAGISGGSIPSGATISAQTAGTPGGVGTYTLSAAATVAAAGVPVASGDVLGGKGLYTVSNAQSFASTTVTTVGTAQATGFKVRGTYNPLANEIGKISTL